MLITNNNKYPFFDLSEIVVDQDFPFKPYQPLKPVKAGNYVPGFKLYNDYSRWQQFYNGAETHGPISLRHLLNKPLVIAFYSHHWREQGNALLKQLNNLHHEIKASGGNLLIISDKRTDELEARAWENSFTLNFYHDENKELARAFRIFSDEAPIWDRFSGIDVNVPLLATYVVDPSKQVIYSHVDLDFLDTFSGADIVSTVYESALIANSRKSA